jgi:predicted component of type VI protein secretion system
MMNNYKQTIFLAAILMLVAGCDSGKGSSTAKTFTVTVTSVGVVNNDSGATLSIEGFPVQGGVLIVK